MKHIFTRNGFTLIELLAVVLIIGILTSVAVPKYNRAMRRSEAMEALVNLRALFDSARRAKTANTNLAPQNLTLSHVDIDFFGASDQYSNTFKSGNYTYRFLADGVSATHDNDGNGTYTFKMYYKFNGKKDVLTCSYSGSYLWLCENFADLDSASGAYIIE